MLRSEKDLVISQLKSDFETAAVALFVDFTGLTVEEANAFRRKLQESEVGYRVVKNTLVARAMDGKDYADISSSLKGSPTGVVIGNIDPVAPAKVTFDFIETTPHLKIKGGVLDNKALTPAEVEALSKMPSREEMQAQIVAIALSAGSNILGQIKNPAGRIVGALDTKAEVED